MVPPSIKSGIVMGTAVTAAFSQFKAGAGLYTYPITIFAGSMVVFYFMFSTYFKKHSDRIHLFKIMGRFAFACGVFVCLLVGAVTGEIDYSSVSFSQVLAVPDFAGAVRSMSPFFIGFAPLRIWLQALPIAFVAYIIAFGDFITVKQLGMDAAREDELVDYNTNRTNVVCGLRNLFLGLLTPFPPLGGPMSAPYAVSTFQRYKNSGREGMDSIWDGYGTNMILAVLGLFCYPLYLVALAAALLEQILEDRKGLEAVFQRPIRGMAYPYGAVSDGVTEALALAGIVYSRTVESHHQFYLPKNWLRWGATCHHNDPGCPWG